VTQRSVPTHGDSSSSRWNQLAEVADLYYVRGQTQAKIADALGVSRVMVSRMLAEAASDGVVEFQVHWESPRRSELEQQLESAFPGVRVLVVAGHDDALPRTSGRLAATEVEQVLKPAATLAISYGRAVHETIRALHARHLDTVQVVQMAGVEGANHPQVDGWELVRLCADRLGARYHYLPASLYSSSFQLHETLLQSRNVSEVLDRAERADVALVGVGSMDPTRSSLVRAGHLTSKQLAEAASAGSVGYICGRHYDVNGEPIDSLNKLTMSLELRKLRGIAKVIGVAHGLDKALPLLGALQGGYLSTVVTDESAARRLLDLTTHGRWAAGQE
jgi:deoxyribonucleoside regulator